MNKYDSILAAVEFSDSIDKLQKILDGEQLLNDKQFTLGLLDPKVKKLNQGKPSEIFVSINRIQFQERDYVQEKSNDIIGIILSLNKARKGILNVSIPDEIKFCGAIIALTYNLTESDNEIINKIFNFGKTNKEVRNFNLKSSDSKFNYNIAMEYNHENEETKVLKVSFDVNNIYQNEEKKIEQLNEIMIEIKSKVDRKEDFLNFINTLL